MALTQEQLQSAFKSGDNDVIAALYAEGFPAVRKFVVSNSGRAEDARDVYQDAMTIVWLNVQEGKYKLQSEASLQGYLFQIAKYKWLDKLKSKEWKTSRPLASEMEGLADGIEPEDDSRFQYLKKIYAGLGDKCKGILELFYYQNKSLEEIGTHLGFDADSIRTMKYRCMMQLRKFHQEEQSKL